MQDIISPEVETRTFSAFRNTGIKEALQSCKDANHRALFAPEIAIKRILAPKEKILVPEEGQDWKPREDSIGIWKPRTAQSVKVTGWRGDCPINLYAHEPHHLCDPENIPDLKDRIEGAAPFPQEELERLAETIDEQFVLEHQLAMQWPPDTYGISEPTEAHMDEYGGKINGEDMIARNNPHAIAFLGQHIIEPYLTTYAQVRETNEICIWYSDDLPAKGEKPRARMLFFDLYGSELDTSSTFSDYGCFEGVPITDTEDTAAVREARPALPTK